MANKFEIKIVKEANGNIVHLNKMSLQASQSLVKIIEGINKIIEAENDPSINVKLVEGCVGVEIEAPIAKMNTIQSEVKKVLNKESRNIPYLEALREIQTVIKANGITYGDNIFSGDATISLVSQLKEIADIRAPKQMSDKDYIDIEFFKGKLYEQGGKTPNIHIETQNTVYKINCTSESQARRVRNELYQDIRVSAWVTKQPDQKFKYTFCDYYKDENKVIFQELKDSVRHIITAGGTEPLEMIHDKFYEFISNQRFEDARLFIKTFCHHRVDNNILRTLLVVTKGMKERPEFKDLVIDITAILLKKTKKPIL